MKRSETYAGRLERMLANIIDSMAMILPAFLLVNIGGEDSALTIIGSFLVNMAYYTGFTASRWQATPGQRAMGIHVARNDGKPISQRDALERFLAFAMPTLPLYLSVAPQEVLGMVSLWLALAWYGPIMLRDDRRGVHDILCNMKVLAGRK